LQALFGLDAELAHVVASTTEPMLGEIRLAWWRDALTGLDAGRVPAQPLLQQAAATLLPAGIPGAELAGLEDRWLGLLGSDAVPAEHIVGGGLLFALAARLLGGEPDIARALGEIRTAGAGEVPQVAPPLRPLRGLATLALRDAARARAGQLREAPGTPVRQLILFAAVAGLA